jgi:Bacterial regulatory proteins, tetR family
MSTAPEYSRLDPGQRSDQILDAANALFAERGYGEVSVEDIASSAGVPGGSCTTTSAAAKRSTSRCSSAGPDSTAPPHAAGYKTRPPASRHTN